MMGHRQRLVSGDEVDALTRRGKRVHRWRSGQRVAMKRKANKRARRENACARRHTTPRAASD
jgi:hypothetical protein